jgi:hypothetical protein
VEEFLASWKVKARDYYLFIMSEVERLMKVSESHIVDYRYKSVSLVGDAELEEEKLQKHDLYAYLKKNKMVNGIPVMLMYKKGNASFIPDDSVTGADPAALDAFFKRCGNHLALLERAYANL